MSTTLTPSENHRITVLLIGSDRREIPDPSGHDDIRTDTIMVLSVNTTQNTAFMLSLPRDIYCKLADHSRGRINMAYQIGKSSGYPGGGGMFAIHTVQSLLKIPIDYFLLIDFAAFYAIAKLIGPITVCPRVEIFDDHFPDQGYGFTQVYFPSGPQELNARQLLQYARVRHNAGYDFGRAERQQEIIRAVRHRVLNPHVMIRLIFNGLNIWRSVRKHIETNMPLEKMVFLTAVGLRIPQSSLYSGLPTVRHGHLRNVLTGAKEQVLLPVNSALHDLLSLLMEASPANVTTAFDTNHAPQGFLKTTWQRLGKVTIESGLFCFGVALKLGKFISSISRRAIPF